MPLRSEIAAPPRIWTWEPLSCSGPAQPIVSQVPVRMTGCAKRCKQGLVKFALSLHKLVTGTLIKGKSSNVSLFHLCKCKGVFMCVSSCMLMKLAALKATASARIHCVVNSESPAGANQHERNQSRSESLLHIISHPQLVQLFLLDSCLQLTSFCSVCSPEGGVKETETKVVSS